MPKSIVVGNGTIAVGLDRFGLVRDFYFPYIGLENHVGGHTMHRIGVWVDGLFSWLNDGSWNITIDCEHATFEGITRAAHDELGVVLTLSSVVYNEKNIFVRRIEIKNTRKEKRQIRLFFCQEFELYEAHRGDTVYYDPKTHSIVHYNGQRVFLINAQANNSSFNDYTTGIFGVYGKNGSYIDAQDGVLSRNAVEHGPTDSVIAVHVEVPAEGIEVAHYWIAVGESIKEALMLNTYVLERSPAHLIETTGNFWSAWAKRYQFELEGLTLRAKSIFDRSMYYARIHADNHGGIVASCDSDMFQGGKDTYAYIWPRDAAYVAMALDEVGATTTARRFFQFAERVVSDDGYFMHKYRPDGSLGSSWHPWIRGDKIELPIQEDETALVLIALWNHYLISRDLEFVEGLYNSFIKRAALFLMGYRDVSTGLPKQSYDLWEEQFGVHTFTAASVYGGLMAAASFAQLLGKTMSQHNYEHAAEEMRRSIVAHLWNEERGAFYKTITYDTHKKVLLDATIDMSSAYGVWAFGVLPAGDERLVRAFETTRTKLAIQGYTGGYARYENDNYYRTNYNETGNPWVITSLWLAQYYIDVARSKADLAKGIELIEWVASKALASGILPEQLDPDTGAHVSASPLAWSHGEYMRTITQYLIKLDALGICKTCNPIKRYKPPRV
ncbi:MAG: glycoside hydrolase family 15 protein [bacterium]|nr:glycoside hydrolase family 15 protein [bacterium]